MSGHVMTRHYGSYYGRQHAPSSAILTAFLHRVACPRPWPWAWGLTGAAGNQNIKVTQRAVAMTDALSVVKPPIS
jgi:hypothetical protein